MNNATMRQRAAASIAVTVLMIAMPCAAQTGASDGGSPRWPTKGALLAAARAGEFMGLPEVRFDPEETTAPLTSSVLHVLRVEYGVPPLPSDRQCRRGAASEVRRLLTTLTAASLDTLTTSPPTFSREVDARRFAAQLQDVVPQLGTGGGYCESEVMGRRLPHPYGAALRKFSDDYSNAVDGWITVERERRQKAFAQEQALRKAVEEKEAAQRQKADADRRAAEQQRIDAERARIESEQKRRQSRVSG